MISKHIENHIEVLKNIEIVQKADFYRKSLSFAIRVLERLDKAQIYGALVKAHDKYFSERQRYESDKYINRLADTLLKELTKD